MAKKLRTANTAKLLNDVAGKPAAAKVKPVAKITAEVAPMRTKGQGIFQHGLKASYSGTSGIEVGHRSKTAINISLFGKKPDAIMTERDNAALRAIKAKYAKNDFVRGDLDAGILRRLGERGYVAYVSGDAASPQAKFKLTQKAF